MIAEVMRSELLQEFTNTSLLTFALLVRKLQQIEEAGFNTDTFFVAYLHPQARKIDGILYSSGTDKREVVDLPHTCEVRVKENFLSLFGGNLDTGERSHVLFGVNRFLFIKRDILGSTDDIASLEDNGTCYAVLPNPTKDIFNDEVFMKEGRTSFRVKVTKRIFWDKNQALVTKDLPVDEVSPEGVYEAPLSIYEVDRLKGADSPITMGAKDRRIFFTNKYEAFTTGQIINPRIAVCVVK